MSAPNHLLRAGDTPGELNHYENMSKNIQFNKHEIKINIWSTSSICGTKCRQICIDTIL